LAHQWAVLMANVRLALWLLCQGQVEFVCSDQVLPDVRRVCWLQWFGHLLLVSDMRLTPVLSLLLSPD
jgi:hypothetical protein